MKIEFTSFDGELPRVQPRLLPPQNAVQASNIRVNRGALEPIRASTAVATLGAAAAGFKLHGSTFIPLTENSDAASGPVAENRLYITRGSDGPPQLYYGGDYYPLALPAPTSKPILTRTGTLNTEVAESVLYGFTWVTTLGEESRLSPISSPIDWSPECTITLDMSASAIPNGRLVTKKRIYRSITSASGITDLFFVAEVSAATVTFIHNISTYPLAEAITSRDYDEPPTTLKGIVSMPNGIMAGFVGKKLYFCEPYIPHAWPDKYSLAVTDEIVGLASFGSTLAILTTSHPYVVQGLHPDSMAMERMEVAAPCLSRRGIVDTGYAAIYPSTDGLIQVSQSGAQLISKSIWTREQWQTQITPATIRAGHFDGRYVFSYRAGDVGTRKLCAVPIDGDGASVLPVDDDPVTFFSTHIETGRLLALKDTDDVSITSFDDPSGALKTYVWRSKPFKLPTQTTMSVIYADVEPPENEAAQFTFKVFADGDLVAMIGDMNEIARIPAAQSSLWQIEISGNCTVTRAVLAGSPDEVWQ